MGVARTPASPPGASLQWRLVRLRREEEYINFERAADGAAWMFVVVWMLLSCSMPACFWAYITAGMQSTVLLITMPVVGPANHFHCLPFCPFAVPGV